MLNLGNPDKTVGHVLFRLMILEVLGTKVCALFRVFKILMRNLMISNHDLKKF